LFRFHQLAAFRLSDGTLLWVADAVDSVMMDGLQVQGGTCFGVSEDRSVIAVGIPSPATTVAGAGAPP
jgi:hypothetical protein